MYMYVFSFYTIPLETCKEANYVSIIVMQGTCSFKINTYVHSYIQWQAVAMYINYYIYQ